MPIADSCHFISLLDQPLIKIGDLMIRIKMTQLITALLILAFSCSASAWCIFSCNYTKTKHPIVLVHGVGGFDTLLGVDYFFGIPDELEDGGATVHVAELSPFNSNAFRGQSLVEWLEDLHATEYSGDPAVKFNLIGHSLGGPDVRYVAAVRPDLVASVSTVGASHKGLDPGIDAAAQAIDSVTGIASSSAAQVFIDFISFFYPNDDPVDWLANFNAVIGDGPAQFNAMFPAGIPTTDCGEGEYVTTTSHGTIRNYSWVGSDPVTNVLDPSDALFGALSLLTTERNDGLIWSCGAHFGRVIRDDYRMNHGDEINQTLGFTSLFETDPKQLYRNHANRLKNAGL